MRSPTWRSREAAVASKPYYTFGDTQFREMYDAVLAGAEIVSLARSLGISSSGLRARLKKVGPLPLRARRWDKTSFPDAVRLFTRPSDGECLEWTRGRMNSGYGSIVFEGRTRQVHAAAWETFRGQVPSGLVIDHMCRNRLCCNIEHLRVVTIRENVLCGEGLSAQNARKTHCIRGHEFSPENTRRSKNGGRICRACNRLRLARDRAQRSRRKRSAADGK
jgi:hypothetical protein